MIKFNDVSFAYGNVPVLGHLTFSVAPGECVALIGRNGSGKSTAISIAAGSLRPDSGSVKVDAPLGYAPQNNALLEDMSVLDNLRFFAKLAGTGVPGSFIFPIDSFLRKKVKSLSGGMKRQVSIVCASLGEPRVLLLDEPCAELDVDSVALLKAQIACWKAEGRAILYAAHDPAEIAAVADRVINL